MFKLDNQQEDSEKVMEEKKKAAEKVGNYAKYVKEMYWPKVSLKKKMELQSIRDEFKITPLRKSASTTKHIGKLNHKIELNEEIDDDYRTISNHQSMKELSASPI
jgi:hypothetical protein